MSVARMAVPIVASLRNQYAPFCAGVSFGAGMDQASPFATDTAEAMGHESLDPCLRPQVNTAEMMPKIVMMDTLLFDILSATHSTKPSCGHPKRRRHAH